MRTNWTGLLMLAVTVVMFGCGPKAETVEEVKLSPRETIKQALEGIAESGQGGSEIGAIMAKLDLLAEEDAALAESLKADANALMGSMDSAQIKAKAKEMLEKLEGGGGAPAPE